MMNPGRLVLFVASGAALLACGQRGGAEPSSGTADQSVSSSDASPDARRVDAAHGADVGTKSATDAAREPDAPAPPAKGASVLEHHNGPTRNGLFIDPLLTRAQASKIGKDITFHPTITGMVRAQPLFVDGGGTGEDMIFVATEQNFIHALDVTGKAIWTKQYGTPVPRSALPCGNIDPYGITGTPIIDLPSRTMFVALMSTPDGGATKKHMIFAVSIDDGSVRTGWPVDVGAAVPAYDTGFQYQRSALGIVGGQLFVPYAGLMDCGSYRGWVISVDVTNPAAVKAWSTSAAGGSSWAVGGVASDGVHAFVATGNTRGASTWGGGEAVLRFAGASGAVFSNATTDFFAPTDWQSMDQGDKDLGSSNPLVLDVPGATPSRVIFQLGKPTTAWMLDPTNLGGVGAGMSSQGGVTTGETATAPASYTTPSGTYVVANASCPGGGTVTAMRVSATSPPKISGAWCADQHGGGSVAVSSTDGTHESVVWGLGATGDNSVEGDGRLHAFDGETGAVLYDGGGSVDHMAHIGRFQAPLIAKGGVYVGAEDRLYRFR